MPSLKDLRNRIDSVKSTKKITQAMKMVAASKLKKAQSLAEKGRSYSFGLDSIVKGLVNSSESIEHPLLENNVGDKNSSLIIVVSSDRGLCGGLNSNIVKAVKKKIDELEEKKISASLVCVGKKGYDLLSGLYEKMFNFEVKQINIGEIDYKSTEEIGKKIAKDINAKIIPPFDDEKVIIGQGTAGIECIEQLNEINVSPDIVLCCCGGGGLIAGISTAIKEKFQNAKIYSVEPENFDDTKKSLKENSIIPNSMKHNSICDALLADKPGKITFEINKLNLTSGLSVSDKEALIAMKTAFEYLKIVLEPGGAVALAAAIFKKTDIRDKNVLVIASGGNVDKDIFENCLNQQAI